MVKQPYKRCLSRIILPILHQDLVETSRMSLNSPSRFAVLTSCSVITASILNGALVLRHEFGHSTLEVGEEYDGGFGYYGPNAAHDCKSFPWPHWLSDPAVVGLGWPSQLSHILTPGWPTFLR